MFGHGRSDLLFYMGYARFLMFNLPGCGLYLLSQKIIFCNSHKLMLVKSLDVRCKTRYEIEPHKRFLLDSFIFWIWPIWITSLRGLTLCKLE